MPLFKQNAKFSVIPQCSYLPETHKFRGSLETGILSRGPELELSQELQAPLRVLVQQEGGPKSGSWWKLTQINSREKHPQLGLLEDRLRYSGGLIKINKHRKRKQATAEFESG